MSRWTRWSGSRRFTRIAVADLVAVAIVLVLCVTWTGAGAQAADTAEYRGPQAYPETGEGLYEAACAQCHGVDGTGADASRLALDPEPPDFTECRFAPREPDGDWFAVIHEGGPARAFDRTMPAFGDALDAVQIQKILDHVRTFCRDESWPQGDLNLPRPLITEKAFPEDEAVLTTAVDVEGSGRIFNEFLYERRFGPVTQIEVKVPFGLLEANGGDWSAGIGDVAVGLKRTMWHDVESGSILSVGGEVILPTGDDESGFGKGTVVLEPFVSFGQILGGDAFVHLQAGLELPTDHDKADNEAFWRAALGRTWTSGRFGRSWTPIVELLGKRDLESGAAVHWDVVPQLQVSLPTRQHVLANVGVQIPLDDTAARSTRLIAYLMWDWFDGGFSDGW